MPRIAAHAVQPNLSPLPRVRNIIADFRAWLATSPYESVSALCGDALGLFRMPREVAAERVRRLAAAYRAAEVEAESCTGCGRCVDACWFDAIQMASGVAVKQDNCIGCGYCIQVCPTEALSVDAGAIVAAPLMASPPAQERGKAERGGGAGAE